MHKGEVINSYRKAVDPKEHEKIRELWKRHSIAEDARDVPGLMSTLTKTCRYEIVNTPHVWDGHMGATQFYLQFLGGMPDVKFELQQIVIGPQGVFEEALLTGTHTGALLGFPPTGKKIKSLVGILFPWDESEQLFTGEKIYLEPSKVF